MFSDFLKRLTQPEPAPLNDQDARLALTALLVRIARSDGTYDGDEMSRIDQIAQQRYELDATGAADLRAQAETLESEAPDTVRFTRAIKDAVPYE
ncbi:MAG: TerB family tellurite resistance protein, partial [Paracoccaceae bacterium]